MDWMLLPLRRYARFWGRSIRTEFWMFMLFLLLGEIVCSVLDVVLGTGGAWTSYRIVDPAPFGIGYAAGGGGHGGVLGDIFAIATLLPSLAVSVRRLHDIGRSGWWLLILLVPFAGAVVLLIFYLTDGTRGPNRFGPDPKHGLDDYPLRP